MSDGITANQLESNVVPVFSATVELTDAQIKALPTVPIVIVPATEVLNYSGLPTQLPFPLAFTVSLDSLAGAYTNLDADADLVIVLGSDASSNALESLQDLMASMQNTSRGIGISNSFHKELVSDTIAPLRVVSGGLQDNALAIFISTGGGNLTGGHADNTMKVTVLYTIIDV